jgi:peptidoglycan hydrolase CwlO-like protein
MAKRVEQMIIDSEVAGSNPIKPTASHSRVFDFLGNIAKDTHSESTAIDHKIVQLMCQRKKLQENFRKTKQRMKEQAEKLRLFEKEMDNIELNISQLKSI